MGTRTTSIVIELAPEERAELARVARSYAAEHRRVVRAKMILELAAGASISAVARLVGTRRRIVQKWARRFERNRLRGLEDAARSGRPPTFSPGGRRASGEAGVRAA
jgi:transposase